MVSMVFYGISHIINPLFDGLIEGKWNFSFLDELIVPLLFGILFVTLMNFYKNHKEKSIKN